MSSSQLSASSAVATNDTAAGTTQCQQHGITDAFQRALVKLVKLDEYFIGQRQFIIRSTFAGCKTYENWIAGSGPAEFGYVVVILYQPCG